LELLAHYHFAYLAEVRRAVLQAMNAQAAKVADLARLNFTLGELYAKAVQAAQRRAKVECALVGCHGQTLYHQSAPALYLGSKVACTWQTGEGAIVAQRLGVPVVSDFRPADMAAGGTGAPLVPFLDYALFRHRRFGRIVPEHRQDWKFGGDSSAGETGRRDGIRYRAGNMVMDAVAEQVFDVPFDRGGRLAAKGSVIESVVRQLLRRSFFHQQPPKSAGREQFGREYVAGLLRLCGRADRHDVLATATALTARSIGMAVREIVLEADAENVVEGSRWPSRYREMVASGGGTKNGTLMRMTRDELLPLKVRVKTSAEFGLPSEAKEAVAFAMLAYQTWRRLPSNVPAATGAKSAAILGKVSYA
jgi:anhydro-N-acetylmuramic acid kinase